MAGLAQGSREREIAPNSRGHSRLSCALAAASAGWSKKVGDIGFLDEAGVLHALGRATDIRGGAMAALSVQLRLRKFCASFPTFAMRRLSRRTLTPISTDGSPRSSRGTETGARALEATFGVFIGNAVRICVVERLPLTEQGKPDRAAIASLGLTPCNAHFRELAE